MDEDRRVILRQTSEIPDQPGPPGGGGGSRAAIVVARMLLLGLATAAVIYAVLLARRGDFTSSSPSSRYVCPMHPDVAAARPGQCPICGMALEAVGGDKNWRGEAQGNGRLGMADVTAVENMRKHKILEVVRMQSLLLNVRELRGAGWVEGDGKIAALFYQDQIDALAPEEPGVFSLTQAPPLRFALRRIPEPATPWDSSTSRIRFERISPEPESGGGRASPLLRAGQVGWVHLANKARDVLTVPAAAILQSPGGPYVLAALGDFKFEKRPIAIGETFLKQGFAVLLSGLRAQERVVARATFFMDADRRLSSVGER